MTVADAVRKGHREGLEALRDKLAVAMDLAEPQVAAQIAGRLQAVLKELADLGAGKQESAFDDLAKRRAARIAGADVPAPPDRPSQQRRRRSG